MIRLTRKGKGMATVSAVLALTACSTDDGVRVMGRVESVAATPSTSTVPSSPSLDPVRWLREDPKVGRTTKDALMPCSNGKYPMDTLSQDLTYDGVPEIVINVYPCSAIGVPGLGNPGDGVPVSRYLGGYVYTLNHGTPVDILALENSASRLMTDRGGLAALGAVYVKGDQPCCPSGGAVTHYHWTGTELERDPG